MPQIRLIDFGLARELGGMDKVKCSMVGTLEFMAPEVDHNLIQGQLFFFSKPNGYYSKLV